MSLDPPHKNHPRTQAKRFKVTVWDDETGVESTFYSDHIETSEEAGILRACGYTGEPSELIDMGERRFQVRGWSGCQSWEDFRSDRVVS